MSLDRTRKLSGPQARTSRVSPSPRHTTPSSFTSNIASPLVEPAGIAPGQAAPSGCAGPSPSRRRRPGVRLVIRHRPAVAVAFEELAGLVAQQLRIAALRAVAPRPLHTV